MVLCQNCGSQQPADAAYCEECGALLQRSEGSLSYAGGRMQTDVPHPPTLPVMAETPARRCARCQTELEPDSVFCHMCGAPVSVPEGGGAASATKAIPAVGKTEVITSTSALLVRLTVKRTEVRVRIPEQQPVMVLGRNDPIGKVYPDIDLTPHGGATLGVSRRHARLFFNSGQLFVEDLQSTNLTRVNGEPLKPGEPHALRSGDELRLGRLSLIVSLM